MTPAMPDTVRFRVSVPVTIRPARVDDLVAISGRAAAGDPASPVRQAFARAEAGEVAVLVAEANGRVAGRLFIDVDLRGRRGAGYLWSLAVDPLLQSAGIGTRLIAHGERLLRGRRVPAARIAVGKDNERARRLYERLGYTVTGETSDEWWDYRDDGARVRVREHCWMLEKRL